MPGLHRRPPSWARSGWVAADRRDPTRGDSEPGRCWTFTNVSEATTDVLSPMCWNVWMPAAEIASRMAWHELGLLPRREVRLPDDINQFVLAPFFGRQAINVDRLRMLMGGLPGTSPEEVDRQFLGMARTDAPPVPRQWARVPGHRGQGAERHRHPDRRRAPDVRRSAPLVADATSSAGRAPLRPGRC